MTVSALANELLLGISAGLGAGVVAALAVGTVALVVRLRGRSPPSPLVGAVLGIPVAATVLLGAGTVDPQLLLSTRLSPDQSHLLRLGSGCAVASVCSLYGASLGTRIADDLPTGGTLPTERGEPLRAAAVDAVDAVGRVTIRPAGEIRTIDGYPSLPPALRRTLETGAWRLPADLPLAELEARFEARLETDYDLADVSVAIDRTGSATIAAAPPSSGISRDLPDGWRAVTVGATIPTGLAGGDAVDVFTGAASVSGTVLAVESRDEPTTGTASQEATSPGTDQQVSVTGTTVETVPRVGAPTRGGVGRVTVAVPTAEAGPLLRADEGRLVVRPGETSPDAEAVSLLERGGAVIRRLHLDRSAVAAAESADGVELLAVDAGRERSSDSTNQTRTVADRRPTETGWRVDPDGELPPTVEAFVAGDARAVASLDHRDSDRASEEVRA